MFLRNEEQKRGYKGPLFEAMPGDLIISKIRVGQGSFCVIGGEVDHVAVSPEYPVYTPDISQVDPRYLVLVLRTPEFLAQLTDSAFGNTTKRRIRPDFFETRRIPLPNPDQQRNIVTAHNAALGRATGLEREADETEAKAVASFEAAVGLKPSKPLPDRPLFAASFRDFDRWSHESILRRIAESDTIRTTPYPIVQLGEAIADLENGWSPKCHDRPAEDDEWGVLKVSAASSGEYRDVENKALPSQQKPKYRLEVRAGDVLITRASGVARLVGVATFVETTQSRLMICDKIFRIVAPDHEKIDVRFLAHVLGIHSVRAQIEREFSTKSGMMKNISKPALLALTFPRPPKNEQVDMVEALIKSRAMVAELRRRARKARAKAWADFEAAVYTADDDATTPRTRHRLDPDPGFPNSEG